MKNRLRYGKQAYKAYRDFIKKCGRMNYVYEANEIEAMVARYRRMINKAAGLPLDTSIYQQHRWTI